MNPPAFRPVHVLLTGLIVLALFGSLTIAVKRHLFFAEWDRKASDRLHEHAVAHPEFTAVLGSVTTLSDRRQIWVEGATGLLVLALLRRWRWLCVWAIAVAGSFAGQQLKTFVDRARPVFEDAIVRESSRSFPSSHSVGSILIFGTLLWISWQQWPRLRWLTAPALIALIVAIGFSRVYLGAHWPSDVLGGYLFGLGWLLVAIGIVNAVSRRRAASVSTETG
jgi:undecaprenyl-diphosphatase